MWEEDFTEYFNDNNIQSILTKHHRESYNIFIKEKILQIIESQNPIIINIEDFQNKPLQIKINIILDIDNILVIDNNIYPSDCRITNGTYEGKIMLKSFNIVFKNNNIEKLVKLENIVLTKLPVCILSEYCNLHNKPKNEFGKYNECKNELGGYYIINGNEKIIISQERLISNKLWIHSGIEPYKYIAEIKSVNTESFDMEKTIYLKYKKSKK